MTSPAPATCIVDRFPDCRDSLLPIAAMQKGLPAYRDSWKSRGDFPYLVMENFFEERVLDRVLEDFPDLDTPGVTWKQWSNEHEHKFVAHNHLGLSTYTRFLMMELNSLPMLEFITAITGQKALVSDPYFQGAGLTLVPPVGFLNMHADFNANRFSDLHRRFNLIVYLNRDWRDGYHGELVIQDETNPATTVSVTPKFNTMVLFPTLNRVLHGHPEPLACPPGMSRKSLSVYYFSMGLPREETGTFTARFP